MSFQEYYCMISGYICWGIFAATAINRCTRTSERIRSTGLNFIYRRNGELEQPILSRPVAAGRWKQRSIPHLLSSIPPTADVPPIHNSNTCCVVSTIWLIKARKLTS